MFGDIPPITFAIAFAIQVGGTYLCWDIGQRVELDDTELADLTIAGIIAFLLPVVGVSIVESVDIGILYFFVSLIGEVLIVCALIVGLASYEVIQTFFRLFNRAYLQNAEKH